MNGKPEREGKRHGRGLRIDDARLAELVAQRLEARELADALGVSKQAVYARLAALGLREKFNAGSARLSNAPADVAPRYGLTVDEYAKHRASGAILAFCRQRDTAKGRGIEWKFTFLAWWRMWEDSGKWPLRGRCKGRGGWEMSRPGDVGPYSPDNVVIVPHKVNMAEIHDRLAARRLRKNHEAIAEGLTSWHNRGR